MKNQIRNLRPGDLYWMDETGEKRGHEQKKRRIWMLIRKTSYSDLWQVACLGPDSEKRKGREHEEWIRTDASGRESVIFLTHYTTVDPSRFEKFAGTVPPVVLRQACMQMSEILRKEAEEIDLEAGG